MTHRLGIVLIALIILTPFEGFSCCRWWGGKSDVKQIKRISSASSMSAKRTELVDKVSWARKVLLDYFKTTGAINPISLEARLKQDIDSLNKISPDLLTPFLDQGIPCSEKYPLGGLGKAAIIETRWGLHFSKDVLKAIRYSFTIFEKPIPLTMFVDACLEGLDTDDALKERLRMLLG